MCGKRINQLPHGMVWCRLIKCAMHVRRQMISNVHSHMRLPLWCQNCSLLPQATEHAVAVFKALTALRILQMFSNASCNVMEASTAAFLCSSYICRTNELEERTTHTARGASSSAEQALHKRCLFKSAKSIAIVSDHPCKCCVGLS